MYFIQTENLKFYSRRFSIKLCNKTMDHWLIDGLVANFVLLLFSGGTDDKPKTDCKIWPSVTFTWGLKNNTFGENHPNVFFPIHFYSRRGRIPVVSCLVGMEFFWYTQKNVHPHVRCRFRQKFLTVFFFFTHKISI